MITPIIVQQMVTDQPGTWRLPFMIIGILGMLWVIPWLTMIGKHDLDVRPEAAPQRYDEAPKPDVAHAAEGQTAERKNPYASPLAGAEGASAAAASSKRLFIQRFLALCADRGGHQSLLSLFPRLAAEVPPRVPRLRTCDGQLLHVGLFHFDRRGLPVNRHARQAADDGGLARPSRRMSTFFVCTLLTALSTVAAFLPKGPALLGVLLVIGFGALGLFPNYYSLTQELSARHQGKVTGSLGCITWTCTAVMQYLVGESVDATGSYAGGIFVIGLLPFVAFLALTLFWNWPQRPPESAGSKAES